MTEYLRDLFLNEKDPLTRSQYMIMLSMLWTLTSIYLVSTFTFSINVLFIARFSTEALAEFSLFANIASIFVGFSIPWAFTALVLSYFYVKRAYAIKSLIIVAVMTLLVFLFFRIVLMAPALLTGNFDQIWSAKNSLPGLESKIDILEKICLIAFVLGLMVIFYPIKKLSELGQKPSFEKTGKCRVQFAKIVLFVNCLVLVINLLILTLFKLGLDKYVDEGVVFIVFGLISLFLVIFFIYIIWQRLKNANKSISIFIGLLLYLVFAAAGAYIAWISESLILSLIAPFLIDSGIFLFSIFICYLYLIPEADRAAV